MDPVVEQIAGLADVTRRDEATAAMARRLGAAAVMVFIPDPDITGKLIPAPGCGATVPAARGWRELLARCAAPGVYAADVAFPTASSDALGIAYAFDGVVFVVVGGGAADPEVHASLGAVAPLVASMLRAEAVAVGSRGELAMARQSAQRSAALARALDAARGDAERATRVKDEFLAMLGHELRNPLAPIVTALQMLRMQGASGRAQEVLERQVAHLLRLVDDLLDVSRITRGKIELRREPIEVATAVSRAVEITRPLLEQRRSRLSCEVPPRGLMVDVDPARLVQALTNLLTNAARYSDPESRIRISAARDGERIRILVDDDGIGIDASYLERVFEQFVQVPQRLDRAVGGLGVGLPIVRSLVELHGGTVRAYSDGLGRGSRFVVDLPACDSAAPAAPPPPPSPPPEIVPDAAALLVVDDNRDAAELLGEVLAAQGHEVRVAHTGPEALQVVRAFTPDAALLDLGLPVMDGFELGQLLRSQLPQIRLVALTGYGQPNDRVRTRAAGFDAHLVKPVTLAEVVETLAAILPPR